MTYTRPIPRNPSISYHQEYDPRILRYVHHWTIHVQQEVTQNFEGVDVTVPESLFWRTAYVKSKHKYKWSRYKAWKAQRQLKAEYKRWFNAYVEDGKFIGPAEAKG